MRDEAKVPRWGLYTMKYTYISQKQKGVGIQSMGGRSKKLKRDWRDRVRSIVNKKEASVPGETE